jgi:hypothetical protein
MIDRDVRRRLLAVLDIMRNANCELTVQDIIYQIKLKSPYAQVERRAIVADLKSLEQFGYVILRNRGHNTYYAKFNTDVFDIPEANEFERIPQRALF